MKRAFAHSPLLPVVFAAALISLGVLAVGLGTVRAGDNLDHESGGVIFDGYWDQRLYSGAGGFPSAVEWLHNPAGIPGNLVQADFEQTVETSFNNWEAVDPLVPRVALGGVTAVSDGFGLDGVNLIEWRADLGGAAATAPCWVLTQDATTIDDGAGNALMPVSGGTNIPFPGPPGETYSKGTLIDCGMLFFSGTTWSTSAGPAAGALDVESIATHEGGHFLGLSHSAAGVEEPLGASSPTMRPFGEANNIDLRTLEEDDRASALRTYHRNNGLPQTAGGRAVIELDLLKGAACEPATGLSVIAYQTSAGLSGANRVETFSGSQLRAGGPDEPANGSVTLNVQPGETYTIYAHTFDDNTTSSAGPYSAFRYNNTTIKTNTRDQNGNSRAFDNLATVGPLAPGEIADLGGVGILGCWFPVAGSQIDLSATAATAPADAVLGQQIAVTGSFTNQGATPSGAFEVGYYFSQDPVINTDDVFSGFSCNVAGLGPGQAASCDGSAPVPALAPGVYYLGMLVDRGNSVGESDEANNGAAAPTQVTVASDPANPIVNGSFETGDFSGWNIKEISVQSNPHKPLIAEGAGVVYPGTIFYNCFFIWCSEINFFTSAPTDGSFAALHDFNGDDLDTQDPSPAPGDNSSYDTNRRELYQDVTLPPNATTLEFDYRAAWELFRFGSTTDRTFGVDIEPAGGGAPLASDIILFALNGGFEEDTANPSGGTGSYPPGVVDVSAFAGQDVRIKFFWNIPEPGTGFGFFQLDNVRLTTTGNTPPTVSITAPADGSTFTLGDSVDFSATASDLEDRGLTADGLSWTSDIDGSIGSGGAFSTTTLSAGLHTVTAAITDSGGLEGADAITVEIADPQNTPPLADPQSVATGEDTAVAITLTGSDADTDPLTFAIASGPSNGSLSGTAPNVIYTPNPNFAGADGFTFVVNDGTVDSAPAAVDITVSPVNDAPVVSISAPVDGVAVVQGQTVSFAGAASDVEDGDISAGLGWTSSLDGAIGAGAGFSSATLSVGAHTITAAVTDSGGLPGSAAITVDVAAYTPPVVTISSPADGAVFEQGTEVSFAATATDAESGDLTASLSWTSNLDGEIGGGGAFSTSALSLGAHTITAAVVDLDGAPGSAVVNITIEVPPPPVLTLEQVVVPNVDNTAWTTVSLANVYGSMVVVCSPSYDSSSGPLVPRVDNAVGSAFDLRVDRADGLTDPTAGVAVHCIVVEEGVFTVAEHGVKMEAVKYLSTSTDRTSSWSGEARSYANAYTEPVVVGQVMSYNDANFSVFWARGANRGSPPSSEALFTGKHVAQDSNSSRADETIGYIVIEAGAGQLAGLDYVADTGSDTVLGVDDSPPYSYSVGALEPTAAVVSSAAMDGNDGGWPILYGATPLAGGLRLAYDEDQIKDLERKHTSEQVAYLAFGTIPEPSPSPFLERMVVNNITDAWTTVNLSRTYGSLVAICAPNYDASAPPLAVRMQNAGGASFDVSVARTDGLASSVAPVSLHCAAVEEGVYNVADHGVKMEAVKYASTTTDRKSSWNGQARSYANAYSLPVVVGQVMSANDPGFSVFWARGSSSKAAPSSASLFTGKHVAEDTDVDRAVETVGYIVIEAGSGAIDGVAYEAGLGADSIQGVTNAPPYNYSLSGLPSVSAALVSSAAMDGNDGGWPVLYGVSAVTPTTLSLAIDEDQFRDTERGHTTEQVAYVVLE